MGWVGLLPGRIGDRMLWDGLGYYTGRIRDRRLWDALGKGVSSKKTEHFQQFWIFNPSFYPDGVDF